MMFQARQLTRHLRARAHPLLGRLTCLKAQDSATACCLACVYVSARVCVEACVVHLLHQRVALEEVSHSSSVCNAALHPESHLHKSSKQVPGG
jgi:hypothetical protein